VRPHHRRPYVHACPLNPTAAQTNVEPVRLSFVLLSRVAHRHAAALCHDPGRFTGATLDIAAAAAVRRRANRDGCTLGRTIRAMRVPIRKSDCHGWFGPYKSNEIGTSD
jgi:hypothetical protein